MQKVLRILGIRGIPAGHGGFETFAEALSLYLTDRGWKVIVYCQEEGSGPIRVDQYQGVERVIVPVSGSGALSTIVFDWISTWHAAGEKDLCLTLGYNTAIFCALLRLKGVRNVINMDGLEWKRSKWGVVAKTWFWLNERFGCWFGNHLVADHPEIEKHLQTRVSGAKITMIPYGSDPVEEAQYPLPESLGLQAQGYLTVIARPEPENSVLEIVEAFSEKPRGCKLVVLGKFSPDNAYHQRVKQAASDEVLFLGAIYDQNIVRALRVNGIAYVHGHQVGGTNPSLVEALGCGNAVLAHANRFNQWVAGSGARYFGTVSELSAHLDELLGSPTVLGQMRASSAERWQQHFTQPAVLGAYERVLERWLR
ncbi:DUF1972 domain-containing protein [Roseateles sp. BYS180W]|uniref:DUF1972 domain-containing protein n=1 Tax=Roseateles rivi TaxID=3299028 RepID=A0ABW7FRR4_9BURK